MMKTLLAVLLERERRARDLTREKFEALLGMGSGQYSRIMRGQRPRPDTAAQLAAELKTTAAEIDRMAARAPPATERERAARRRGPGPGRRCIGPRAACGLVAAPAASEPR